jgi:hypothetical protein|nr:MAG TPA: hypothetical protein [Caudoviricetes sp.]
MENKPLKLMLTFKQDEKWLYDEVCNHSGKGNWIKDVLKEHLKNQGQENQFNIQACNSPLDDLL